MVTLEDVARKAGVSLATASYALNRNRKIKQETRDRVLKAAEELGYIPNGLARGLSGRRTKTIGLVIANISIPYFAAVAQHIEREVRKRGYSILFGISNDDIELETKIINNFRESRVDGIIVAPGSVSVSSVNEKHLKMYSDLNLNDMPYVFVNAVYPGLRASYVIPDLTEGTYKLTSYLLEKGYRKIVFFAGRIDDYPSQKRYDGYSIAFKEHGIEPYENTIVECKEYSFEAAYRKAKEWIDSKKRLPDVFMLSNDEMGLGVLKALKEANINVPHDVALVGYDDIVFPQLTEVSLTTVRIPIKEMCIKAVDILISGIENDVGSIQQIFLEPELVVRDSA